MPTQGVSPLMQHMFAVGAFFYLETTVSPRNCYGMQ